MCVSVCEALRELPALLSVSGRVTIGLRYVWTLRTVYVRVHARSFTEVSERERGMKTESKVKGAEVPLHEEF